MKTEKKRSATGDAGQHRLVDSALVASASLHANVSRPSQLAWWPYLRILYPLWTVIYIGYYDALLGSSEATFLSLLACVTAHVLTLLAGEWNVRAKATLTTRAVPISTTQRQFPADADRICVIPPPHSGPGSLCPIEHGKDGRISFAFQQQVFVWDAARATFRERAYPVGARVDEYRTMANSGGFSTTDAIASRTLEFGKNEFHIPVPTFAELFREHALAPFFVFQVFCVALWALDEYWYYSLFTLFMLGTFESTVVAQRLRTLNEFRGMTHPPRPVYVMRSNQWTHVLSDAVLPGDVISLPRATKEDHVVPCDCVLVAGSVVVNEAMLSGESTPLHKEGLANLDDHQVIDDEALAETRLHMVYAGTKVVQASAPMAPGGAERTFSDNNDGDDNPEEATVVNNLGTAPVPPDGGAVGVVVRTGFGTTQGNLVRMMVFSSERVSANNLESFLFIGFLLIFAFAAAGYVWTVGQQHGRPLNKLLLDCILIITSVVPPELPMELSMAVNTSLMALSKLAIFCTEPFRIPFAGKLDILCFDKTGTITTEDLVVDGVVGVPGAADPMEMSPAHKAPAATLLVLAAAHALVKLDDGTVIGDPMERAALAASGFAVATTDKVVRAVPRDRAGKPVPSANAEMPLVVSHVQVNVQRKFAFSSALKRMSTVSRVSGLVGGGSTAVRNGLLVAVKGAPEVMQTMLRSVPAHYVATHTALARNGGRVLALAYRHLDSAQVPDVMALSRGDVEQDLEFAGFLVFMCPLKPDSAAALHELQESGHRCTMITGDAALTAVHVARQVGIVDRETLVLDASATNWTLVSDDAVRYAFEVGAVSDLVEQFDLCVTGPALDALEARGALASFGAAAIPYIYVWARVSPAQKEWILTQLKGQGFNTLMCGDGTNDVGALKQSHVGVALLDASPDDLQKIAEHSRYRQLKSMYDKQCEWAGKLKQPAPPKPKMLVEMEKRLGYADKEDATEAAKKKLAVATAAAAAVVAKRETETPEQTRRREQQQQRMDQAQQQLMSLTDQLGDMDEMPTLKFGDASVAAPFTSKLGSLNSITNIIKQGRCTLVTTLQMYKILALNCLISAYAMSVLFLDGMKWGDWQMTIQGLLMAACFFFISRGQPVEKLAQARPLPSFFNAYAVLSVCAQFAIHAYSMYYVTTAAKEEMGGERLEVDFEGKREFSPNLLNAGVYLLTTSMQVSTFAINYIGRPFRESIRENTPLFRGLAVVGSFAFLAAMEVSEDLNNWLQLVPFPAGFADMLTAVMAVDFLGAWAVEFLLKALLSRSDPRKELRITFGPRFDASPENLVRTPAVNIATTLT
ncbi:hypothetical protein BC828DRAFT_408968 [Blastocladiella britannica]|nr:hypothetical protein BC828DRAFT_408968 [Blastocladiella britannica]